MPNLTVTQREDANGYVEGLTYGQAIMMGLAKRTWLSNGTTFTQHVLNDAGQIMIPVFEPDELKGTTDLCEEGTFNKAKRRFIQLLLDKKIGMEFDGCFTVAGITVPGWERDLNNATLMQGAMDYQTSVEASLEAGGTVSTIVKGDLKPSQYLLKLKSEYFNLNKQKATVALVSSDFYNEILDHQTSLGTAGSDYAFVNGVLGTVSGLVIIETDLKADATLINSQGIHIASAGSIKQVPQFGNIIGEVDMTSFNIGFSAGMLSKIDVKPTFIGSNTYVHVPLGVKVIDQLVLKTDTVVAP